ncbi:THUMP-like domain-containing protein [Mucisphaera calidilacus]|uniref:THUMP-like domain-containing protein n=1 Tax=Mucisphaera calidilacus TaxID=2527982 RepID=A0A518BZQ7_9BACT|nr:hypothetical protein [Mucisphaera calidilacus]QDU72456.1 hypothetical protein Pan265_23210 [Mucisphaera calidilacus]
MTPDNLKAWQTLLSEHQPLIDKAAAVDRTTVTGIASLRKHADPALAHLAAQLAEARVRAVPKLGEERAASLIADIEGVEQASSLRTARLKADRFKAAGASRVIDLCSGIGIDAMGCTDAGLDVLAVDRDPVRAWMTARNARCQIAAADAATIDTTDAWLHIDPARRSDGRRAASLEEYEPGPATIAKLIRNTRGACVKLSPALDVEEATTHLGDAAPWSLTFVSEAGRLVQSLWWSGQLAQGDEPGEKQALRIDNDGTHELSGTPIFPLLGPVPENGYLHTLDPAAERADMATILCARHDGIMPHPRAGLVASESVIDSPWLTAFRVETEMGWREDNVRKWLSRHHTGVVEVKPRGIKLDTDALQKSLRGPKKKGGTKRTVFVTRIGEKVRCWITRRV